MGTQPPPERPSLELAPKPVEEVSRLRQWLEEPVVEGPSQPGEGQERPTGSVSRELQARVDELVRLERENRAQRAPKQAFEAHI